VLPIFLNQSIRAPRNGTEIAPEEPTYRSDGNAVERSTEGYALPTSPNTEVIEMSGMGIDGLPGQGDGTVGSKVLPPIREVPRATIEEHGRRIGPHPTGRDQLEAIPTFES
jgi:hypothetical protein